jgi:Pretoxin HINT domain
MIAGAESVWTGESAPTLLNMGVVAGARQFMSEQNAQRLATSVELVAGFGSGVADDALRASVKFAKSGNSAAAASRMGLQHASLAAKVQLGGMAAGAAVGYASTGSIDGALMGASFGEMGGSLAAHFAVACFTAGTPLVVDMEGNSRPIDEIEVGDFVLARSEFDPDGPLELKRVEELFTRVSPVVELTVRGQLIKTTSEHPFFVPAQDRFVPAGELQSGDDLIGHDGVLSRVDSLLMADEVVTVYNMRVAEHHTYFVGGNEWGFDVWVHNAGHLYRGVSEFWGTQIEQARMGTALPRGTLDDPLMHHLNHTDKTALTSWTRDPELAHEFALDYGRGVILRIDEDSIDSTRFRRVNFEDIIYEADEIMIHGPVYGATVFEAHELRKLLGWNHG